jgi:acyl-[acyl-carrier-protein]-phospholipid O-acyltransferase/long-chain-fatty-acid--[acyl-carrier-protein] ligase
MPTWLVHTTIARQWHFALGLRFLPHLVIDTQSPLAIKAVIHLIEAGKPVLIFPEGRITVTGSLMKIYDGPAFAAARSGAAVIPIHIDGAVYTPFSRMSGDFPTRWFPKIRITVCAPRTIVMPEGRTSKIRRRRAAEQMRRIMQESFVSARVPRTIYEGFLDAAALHGRGRRMIEDVQRTYTYGDLIKASMALGRLVSRLAPEGERVGVLMPNVGATVALLLGLFAFRRAPAILNYTSGAEGMQNAIDLARVRVLITSRAFIERARLEGAMERLRVDRLVYLEDLRAQFGLADKLWLLFWAIWKPRSVMRKSKPEEPAVVLFTSGSEAIPKGVVLSHDSILANIEQMRAIIDFSSKDKLLCSLPLFHSFGLTVCTLLPILNGMRTFLYLTPLHFRIVPELVYDRDCTIMVGTNAFLANYVKAAHPYDFQRVRLLISGAEKLTDEVRQAVYEKFNRWITEGYGATECSPVIAANTPLAHKLGTVGEFMPCMDWKLEPVPGIEHGGLLHVRGPNLMLGYIGKDGGVQPGEEWYNTGDIVTVDEDGFVTISGRMKRFAKIAGEMVSLETVERIAAAGSPARAHAAVTVLENNREVITLYTEDAALRRDALVEASRSIGAPELALPKRIVHIDKIPLLGNGKKDYVTLNRMAKDRAEETARVR